MQPKTEERKALDAAMDALLAISNLAHVAQAGDELEVIHLQAIAQGIEALANPQIDNIMRVVNE
jgi:hypothetical protein